MCPTVNLEVLKQGKMSSVSSAIGGKHTCQLCGYQTLKKTQLKPWAGRT
jgi:hypothetical protein